MSKPDKGKGPAKDQEGEKKLAPIEVTLQEIEKLMKDRNPNELIRLESGDGYGFTVNIGVACYSGTIRGMLEARGVSAKAKPTKPVVYASPDGVKGTEEPAKAELQHVGDHEVIKLSNIAGRDLEIVCRYFYHKKKWSFYVPPADIPAFDLGYGEKNKGILQVLLAAHFLQI